MQHATRIQAIMLCAVILAAAMGLTLAVSNVDARYAFAGIALWAFIAFLAYACRPGSKLSSYFAADACITRNSNRFAQIATIIVVCAAILICIFPMNLSPYWNGEIPEHRNQYELFAESLLEGKLYIDYDDIDEKLAELENPYNPNDRDAAHVTYHWDHAYYNGKYYMYFGIVPALTTFVPYRLITGESLTTYHATQIYTGIFVLGLFFLFRLLARRYCKHMPLSVFLILFLCFSMLSTWFATAHPALYCTAITAGMACMVWSFFCSFQAFVVRNDAEQQLGFAFLGAFFGALAFGCRPPIALANIASIPLLLSYIARNRDNKRQNAKALGAVAMPFLLVAVGLMAYNYARFGNVMEFGQAYQLTVADQHEYGFSLDRIHFIDGLFALGDVLVGCKPLLDNFPYIPFSGCFINFPILLAGIAIAFPSIRTSMREKGVLCFSVALIAATLVIIAADLFFSPYFLERYKLDFYYLLSIASFISLCFILNRPFKKHTRISFAICLIGLATCLTSCALFLVPFDKNITALSPDILNIVQGVVTLGIVVP